MMSPYLYRAVVGTRRTPEGQVVEYSDEFIKQLASPNHIPVIVRSDLNDRELGLTVNFFVSDGFLCCVFTCDSEELSVVKNIYAVPRISRPQVMGDKERVIVTDGMVYCVVIQHHPKLLNLIRLKGH